MSKLAEKKLLDDEIGLTVICWATKLTKKYFVWGEEIGYHKNYRLREKLTKSAGKIDTQE